MRRIVCLLAFVFSTLSFAERNYDNFVYLENVRLPHVLKGTVVAFDGDEQEWVWKNFNSDDKEWKVINKFDLDPVVRDVTDTDSVKKLVEGKGITFVAKRIGSDLALDMDFNLKGGGPCTALLCGAACKFIGYAGCGMGSLIVGAANPGVGVIYASLCAALNETGGTMSCITVCLGLPCP